MDKRINRFKLCDLRFYPYLRSIIERLPEEVREIVLNDMSFQILTDDEVLEALVLRYEFGAPVRTLVYLNTKILKEPDHQILHTIASEIAHYILKKEGHRPRVILGKDTRLSGYMLETALATGICSMGADVVLVGPMPTPGISFITNKNA